MRGLQTVKNNRDTPVWLNCMYKKSDKWCFSISLICDKVVKEQMVGKILLFQSALLNSAAPMAQKYPFVSLEVPTKPLEKLSTATSFSFTVACLDDETSMKCYTLGLSCALKTNEYSVTVFSLFWQANKWVITTYTCTDILYTVSLIRFCPQKSLPHLVR